MARRRAGAAPADLRAALAAKWRPYAGAYSRALGSPVEECPAWRRLQALEAGEPVELAGWELSALVPGIPPYCRVRLERNGSITDIAPAHPPAA